MKTQSEMMAEALRRINGMVSDYTAWNDPDQVVYNRGYIAGLCERALGLVDDDGRPVVKEDTRREAVAKMYPPEAKE